MKKGENKVDYQHSLRQIKSIFKTFLESTNVWVLILRADDFCTSWSWIMFNITVQNGINRKQPQSHTQMLSWAQHRPFSPYPTCTLITRQSIAIVMDAVHWCTRCTLTCNWMCRFQTLYHDRPIHSTGHRPLNGW